MIRVFAELYKKNGVDYPNVIKNWPKNEKQTGGISWGLVSSVYLKVVKPSEKKKKKPTIEYLPRGSHLSDPHEWRNLVMEDDKAYTNVKPHTQFSSYPISLPWRYRALQAGHQPPSTAPKQPTSCCSSPSTHHPNSSLSSLFTAEA